MLLKNALAIAVMNAVGAEGSQNGGGAAPVVQIPTEPKEVSYHFKKEKVKNEKGEVIGEGKKLPTVKTSIPVPTADGLLAIISAGGKPLELLQEMMQDVVYERGRQLINAFREQNSDKEVTPDVIDAAQLDWNVIANLPKSERRGLGISDEDFEQFFEDYKGVMPLATGKDLDRIEKHVAIYKRKFATVRNDKKALGVLNDMLALYAASTASMEENQAVYEYLKKRVETLLQEEEKVLAEAL